MSTVTWNATLLENKPANSGICDQCDNIWIPCCSDDTGKFRELTRSINVWKGLLGAHIAHNILLTLAAGMQITYNAFSHENCLQLGVVITLLAFSIISFAVGIYNCFRHPSLNACVDNKPQKHIFMHVVNNFFALGAIGICFSNIVLMKEPQHLGVFQCNSTKI